MEGTEQYEAAARVAEIPAGGSKLVTIRNKPVAIFNVQGKFYAIHDVCPHEGGPLHEGRVKGCIVSCPWHDLAFDLRNGRGTDGGGYCVASYDVRIEGETILIGGRRKA